MPTIELRVFDRATGNLLTAAAKPTHGPPDAPLQHLANADGRQWRTVLNDTGTGGVTLGLADADLAHLAEGNIVRCYIDDVAAFAWVVGPMDQATVASEAEAAEERRITGRGTLSLWADGIVYPETAGSGVTFPPLEERRVVDLRRCDFAAVGYDDGAWAGATVVPPPPALVDLGGAPAGWPLEVQEWIHTRARDGGGHHPVGHGYFRHLFAVAAPAKAAVYITADNGFELMLDGELLLSEMRTPLLWASSRSVQLDLAAGSHLLAVKTVNHTPAGAPLNPAGLAVVVVALDENGDPASVLTSTGVGWKCVDYPDEPPGMTVGLIIRTLMDEAQARGALVGLTLGFTDTHDSDGVPWPNAPDVSMTVGSDYLEVLRKLSELYCDVAMDPASLRLDAWVRRGTDRSGSVVFGIGSNIVGLSHRGGEQGRTNAILGRFGDHWLERTSPGRRQEKFLELGSATSSAQAQRMIDAAKAERSLPVITTVVGYEPLAGVVPAHDFDDGDDVSAPTATGEAAVGRVKSSSVTETDTGYDFAIEVGSIESEILDRLLRLARKTGHGALDGNFANAVPTGSGGGDLTGAALTTATPGYSLNSLSDVVSVPEDPLALGDYLGWNPDLGIDGMWEPRTIPLADTVEPEVTYGLDPYAGDPTDVFAAKRTHSHGTPPEPPAPPEPATSIECQETFGMECQIGTSLLWARADHGHGTPPAPVIPPAGNSVEAETSFGIPPTPGGGGAYARATHSHGTPADPVPAHAAAADPHPAYQRESEKGATSGYPSLDATTLVPVAQMGTGTPDGTKFLRDDRVFATPPDPVPAHAAAADPHPAYQRESEKGAASGYAGLGANGLVPVAQLGTGAPSGAKFLRDDQTFAAPPDPVGVGAAGTVLVTDAAGTARRWTSDTELSIGSSGLQTSYLRTLHDGPGTSSPTAGTFGGRQVRFRQDAGDEANAGVIDYRGFAAELGLIGAGTTNANRTVRAYDIFKVADVVASASGVQIGPAPWGTKLGVLGPVVIDGAARVAAQFADNSAPALGTGAGLGLTGKFNATDYATLAAVQGVKENATSGNYAGALALYTRDNGAPIAERVRVSSAGDVGVGRSDPGAKLDVSGTLRAGDSSTYTGFGVESDGSKSRVILMPTANFSGAPSRSANLWADTRPGVGNGRVGLEAPVYASGAAQPVMVMFPRTLATTAGKAQFVNARRQDGTYAGSSPNSYMGVEVVTHDRPSGNWFDAHVVIDDRGTAGRPTMSFSGIGAVQLRGNVGELEVRNTDDTAYGSIRASVFIPSGRSTKTDVHKVTKAMLPAVMAMSVESFRRHPDKRPDGKAWPEGSLGHHRNQAVRLGLVAEQVHPLLPEAVQVDMDSDGNLLPAAIDFSVVAAAGLKALQEIVPRIEALEAALTKGSP